MAKIIFACGGTGGHIMPAIALANHFKQNSSTNAEKTEIIFIAAGDKQIIDIFKKNKFECNLIQGGKLRRYFDWKNFTDIFRIMIGFFQSLWILAKIKPVVIFSKGGYASFPPVAAGRILGIPVIIHESDLVPGIANRLSAFFASRVAVGFQDSAKYFSREKVVFTGNPIREELLKGNKEQAKKEFGLKDNLPVILVTGGSQGAKRLNEMILEILPEILDFSQIIHLAGVNNYEETKNSAGSKKLKNAENYHIYPFLNEQMKEAYAASDLIISRAGANSINEILSLGKASILVPLSTAANDHQNKNARHFSDSGATIMIDEINFDKNFLVEKIKLLLKNPEERKKMEIKALSLAIPDARDRLSKEILSLVKPG